MTFDITSVLKNVSSPDTGPEQIVYLPIDKLIPDENNFYSLEGIAELADNIATIGLQQPLRVRPAGEPDCFTIVSGHRRRAAIQLLQDGEDDAAHLFDRGVPCIVERGEASAALQELRLIYANANTRVMSASEISKQAERVEMLLYQLKEDGFEFSGRMRDHVAEACQVSKTKLARLHAIRSNLDPEILSEYFDTGKLAETAAYAMSQKPAELQRDIIQEFKTCRSGSVSEWMVKDYSEDAEAVDKLPCPEAGGLCIHRREHLHHLWKTGWRGYDGCVRAGTARCCTRCELLATCKESCPRADKLKERKQEDLKTERRSEREKKKDDEANQKAEQELQEARAAMYWKRLGDALKAARISYRALETAIDPAAKDNKFSRILAGYRVSDEDIKNLLEGKPAKNPGTRVPTPFSGYESTAKMADRFTRMADILNVSLDYLMLRTDDPRGVSIPDTAKKDPPPSAAGGGLQWNTGTPTEPGMYETRIGVTDEDTPQTACWQRLEWFDGVWGYPKTHSPLTPGTKVFRWIKLPEV